MNISERIKKLRAQIGISQGELAGKLGVTAGAISQIENGGGISTELLSKLYIAIPNINPEWLLIGRGEMFRQNISTVSEEQAKYFSSQKTKPIFSDDDLEISISIHKKK